MASITPDPHYATIPPQADLRLSHLPPFRTSSRDPVLITLAASHNAVLACSSSSTTPVLARLYLAQVGDARIDTRALSADFQRETDLLTWRARAPVSATLRRRRVKGGAVFERFLTLEQMEAGLELSDVVGRGEEGGLVSVWGMDRGYATEQPNAPDVLIRIGHSMENLFTLEPDEFNAHFLTRPTVEDAGAFVHRSAYLFTLCHRVMMRSQLDCQDPRLMQPGGGEGAAAESAVFDIKTRAVYPIRHHLARYEEYAGYEIRQERGLQHSYEREWYDMARSVFLKYALQCRMGQMQGVMVAYHNTRRVFGMEMIAREDMERALLGEHTHVMGDRLYELSVRMLDELSRKVVDLAEALHGGRRLESVKLVVEQEEQDPSCVHVFAELTPPPSEDFDAHLPFTHRHATLYRLDQLDLASLKKVAAAHGVEVKRGKKRQALLNVLETALTTSTSRYLPPIEHVLHLLRSNLLLKLELRVQQRTKDGAAVPVGRWRSMDAEDVEGLQSGYSLTVVNTQDMTEGQRARVARGYLKAMEAGYLLEKEAAEEDADVVVTPSRGSAGAAAAPPAMEFSDKSGAESASEDVREEEVQERVVVDSRSQAAI